MQETADIDNIDFFYGLLFDDPITLGIDSDEEQASNELGPVGVIHTTPILSLQEILTGLAQAVNGNKISKFNIARNDIWEGTKRGLTRKSFSPCNEMSIRFSDESGKSEGAVDAWVKGPDKVLTLEEVYDQELKSSLQDLTKTQSVQEACAFIERKNLDTIFELTGTLQQLNSVADIGKIVQQTAHWYILGRVWPALEQFKQGLSDLAVLEAVISSPEVFTPVFCYVPVDLTADMFRDIITVCYSEEGRRV